MTRRYHHRYRPQATYEVWLLTQVQHDAHMQNYRWAIYDGWYSRRRKEV